jgi:hypothetical protein
VKCIINQKRSEGMDVGVGGLERTVGGAKRLVTLMTARDLAMQIKP